MVYMYKEIAETCCFGVYGLILREIDNLKTACEKKTILLFYPCAQSRYRWMAKRRIRCFPCL